MLSALHHLSLAWLLPKFSILELSDAAPLNLGCHQLRSQELGAGGGGGYIGQGVLCLAVFLVGWYSKLR